SRKGLEDRVDVACRLRFTVRLEQTKHLLLIHRSPSLSGCSEAGARITRRAGSGAVNQRRAAAPRAPAAATRPRPNAGTRNAALRPSWWHPEPLPSRCPTGATVCSRSPDQAARRAARPPSRRALSRDRRRSRFDHRWLADRVGPNGKVTATDL